MSQAAMIHPFVINKPLDDSFGYTSAFLKGTLAWDFEPSEVAASTGGGRHTMAAVLETISELGSLTTSKSPLDERQKCLASLFHQHYNDERVQAYLHLMLSKVIKSTARYTKTDAIDLLVQHNVPFIPFEILMLTLRVASRSTRPRLSTLLLTGLRRTKPSAKKCPSMKPTLKMAHRLSPHQTLLSKRWFILRHSGKMHFPPITRESLKSSSCICHPKK